MSVKYALLALIAQNPSGVYALRRDFEERTGEIWPMNIGQVYSTVQRLLRDQLVEVVGSEPATEPGRPNIDILAATALGRDELKRWWSSPIDRTVIGRDEFVMKLALAVTCPEVDVAELLQLQRNAVMTTLRDTIRLKSAPIDPGVPAQLAWSLVLERHIFDSEAEIRWLDHVATEVMRASTRADFENKPTLPERSATVEEKPTVSQTQDQLERF